jgi:glutamyl-tRNA synthetase
LLNYLARLGWSHGDQEIFSTTELIEYFTLEHIGKKAAIFDFEKLAWVNSVYLRQKSEDELLEAIVQDIEPNFLSEISWHVDQIKQAVSLYKERVKTVKMLAAELKTLHDGPSEWDADDMQKWITPETPTHIRTFIELLERQESFTHDSLAANTKECATQLGIKLVALLQPVRLALIGKASGPGVFDMLEIVGKTHSIVRLRRLFDSL